MAFQRHFLTAPPYCSLGKGQPAAARGLCHFWAIASSPTFSFVSTFLFSMRGGKLRWPISLTGSLAPGPLGLPRDSCQVRTLEMPSSFPLPPEGRVGWHGSYLSARLV